MDTAAADVPGPSGGELHPEPALLRGEGLPPGCLLSDTDALPHPQDGAAGERSEVTGFIC